MSRGCEAPLKTFANKLHHRAKKHVLDTSDHTPKASAGIRVQTAQRCVQEFLRDLPPLLHRQFIVDISAKLPRPAPKSYEEAPPEVADDLIQGGGCNFAHARIPRTHGPVKEDSASPHMTSLAPTAHEKKLLDKFEMTSSARESLKEH